MNFGINPLKFKATKNYGQFLPKNLQNNGKSNVKYSEDFDGSFFENNTVVVVCAYVTPFNNT